MRILVLSDIHANATALEAAIKDAGSVDAVWCLGDVVGYGPDPNECIGLLCMQETLLCLLGNHDAAVIDRIQLETFNQDARRSIEWTQEIITPESYEFLSSLPESFSVRSATLAHGSPRNPIWEYLLDLYNAAQNFSYFDTQFCMVGHTHLPIAYLSNEGDTDVRWVIPLEGETLKLESRAILNPGSVGQPRDHDPRASYGVFDPDECTWEVRRVDYDIRSVQKRIRTAALPSKHALRLLEGW